jgi:hypothetical protein
VLGGVGWSTPYPDCFTSRKDSVPSIEEFGWGFEAGPDGYKKITSPLGFEHQTVQSRVSCYHTHQDHNNVNVNNNFSYFHGGHFLVSYTMW